MDLWAKEDSGRLTFETLVGYSPFSAPLVRGRCSKAFSDTSPTTSPAVIQDAIDLVKGLLRKDVEKRFGISEDLLGHAYFRDKKFLYPPCGPVSAFIKGGFPPPA